MGKTNQFVLLQWKNWKIQSRKPIATFLEIFLPVMLSVILVGMRQIVEPEDYPEPTTWSSFPIEDFDPDLVPYSDRLPDLNFSGLPSSLNQLPGLQTPNLLNSTNLPDLRWVVAYCPNDSVARTIMWNVARNLDIRPQGFATEEELVEYSQSINGSVNFLSAVIFQNPVINVKVAPKRIEYKMRPRAEQYFGWSSSVRFYASSDWQTEKLFPLYPGIGPRNIDETDGGKPGYYREGFLPLQHHVDRSIIRYLSNSSAVDDVTVEMKRSPFPPYIYDVYVYVLENDLGFVIILSFLMAAPNIVKDLVLEKERKLREIMQLMGLKIWKNNLSWFTKYFLFLLISCLTMTLLLHVPMGTGATIPNSDPSVTFVFLVLYSIATIMFCFMIASFFSKANSGAAAGAIIFLLTYVPFSVLRLPVRWQEATLANKLGISIFHNSGVCLGCIEISKFELTGIGLQWNNLFDPLNPDDPYCMAHCFIMLALNSVLYGLIAWYFDAVMPRDYGVSEKFYFPFTKAYWCGVDNSGDAKEDEEAGITDSSMFERSMSQNNAGIKIRQLKKEFHQNGECKTAVNGINLDIYEDQITALLGHNGAGKTTTIFMLTGFFPPTSGTAYVNGHDIRSDIKGVRESLGLCPQHDVLFDTLTVKEHLQFFAQLKGCETSEVDAEVNKMIQVLRLTDKTNTQARALSGGMKRKLCVGMALVAGSKTVILDEPTSGMDPEARRQTWDILQSQREGRTMILTTHFMDEADYLGDRIAIMAAGDIKCCGSSWFLKQKYGVGYHLTMVKRRSCLVEKVTDFVQSYVPAAVLESNMANELSYVLPKESSDQFEKLFSHLEKNKEPLGLQSFGASVTTMEEVFLKVGEESDELLMGRLTQDYRNESYNSLRPNASTNTLEFINGYENTMDEKLTQNGTVSNGAATNGLANGVKANGHINQDIKNLKPAFGVGFERISGFNLYWTQFCALLVKRIIHSYRNRLVTVTQLLVPLIFSIIGCIIIVTVPGPGDPPPLNLDLSSLNEPSAPYSIYYGGDGATDRLLENLGESWNEVLKDTAFVEFVNNVTGSPNMTEYLVDRADAEFSRYRESDQIALTLADNNSVPTIIGFFNNEGFHSAGMSMVSISNMMLRHFVPDEEYEIRTTNHPMPRTLNSEINEGINTAYYFAGILSFEAFFGMAFLVGSFVLFLIHERVEKSKHIQFVSGVHVANYWFSTFLWDIINYLIPTILQILMFWAFGIDAFVSGSNFVVIFLVYFFYAWSVIPFVYLLSFAFNVPSSGYVWVTLINLLSATIAGIIVGVLFIPELDKVHVAEVLDVICKLFLPNYNFVLGLQYVYQNHEYLKYCRYGITGEELETGCQLLEAKNLTNPCCPGICGGTCAEFKENYLAWGKPGIGSLLSAMALQGVVAFALVLFIESDLMAQIRQKFEVTCSASETEVEEGLQLQQLNELDSDVKAEHDRIMYSSKDSEQNDILILKELKKVYNGGFYAVKGLTLGVPMGECFGLLGVNGAGKTSTFKMMTGDEPISAGEAYLCDYSVIKHIKEVRQHLGYCPQFDALIQQMTVRETLTMYAKLRGVESADVPDVVDTLIHQLLLKEHEDKQAGSLSGGNKRKLSTAIALIGDPPLVFLDEPTTGMDPVARRLLWDTLHKFRASGRTIILTSHSMEECEALCTRLAIMVNGQFQCFGSTQHLKSKFGDGFTIIAKLQNTSDPDIQVKTEKLQQFIERQFKECTLKEEHTGYVNYHVASQPTLTWGKLFGEMEKAKELYDIEDYSVSQTNLEQIFLGFARNQEVHEEVKKGCCTRAKLCCATGCCSCRRSSKVAASTEQTHF